jgi:hypothetical protein
MVFPDIAQPNLIPGFGQKGAKQTTHRPGTHNGYFHFSSLTGQPIVNRKGSNKKAQTGPGGVKAGRLGCLKGRISLSLQAFWLPGLIAFQPTGRFCVFVIKKCLSQNPYRIFIAHGPDLTSRPQNAVMLPLPVEAVQSGSGQKHACSGDETDSPMVGQSDWGRHPSW